MRKHSISAAVSALALFLVATPVDAYEPPLAPAAVSTVELEASRDLLRALLINSDILPRKLGAAYHDAMGELRQRIATLPFMERLTPPRRQAVSAFLETLPRIAEDELAYAVPQLVDEAAPEVADLFSVDDLVSIVRLLNDEAIADVVRSFLDSERGDLTNEEIIVLTPLVQSQGGQALLRQGRELNQIIGRSLDTLTLRVETGVTARMVEGLCTAMADECPVDLAGLITPI